MSQQWWSWKSFILLFVWIVSIFSSKNGGATLDADVSVLRDVRKSMNVKFLDWYSGDPCESEWQGIICDATKTTVTGITLINKRLSGSLPSSIGNLASLQTLDLSLNPNLRGPIPSSIGNLVNLDRLNLQNCGFSGRIPNEIGQLSSLSFLALNGNALTGRIPSTIGLLQSLDWCDLSNNMLDGELPISASNDIGFDSLTILRHMHLNNNNLSGAIPPKLSTMPKLIHLLLDNNQFSGNIPSEIGSFPQLKYLRLDNNQFDGPVPETISDLSTLVELHLANNRLDGVLPDLSLMENLQLIRASYASFTPSEFPPWILEMPKLKTLELIKGNLLGHVPEELFALPNLEAVFLDENLFNGSVDFTNVSRSLEVVSLQQNDIVEAFSVPLFLTLRLLGNPVCANNEVDNFCVGYVRLWKPPEERCNETCGSPMTLLPSACTCAYPLICTLEFITPPFSAITVERVDNITEQLSSVFNISRTQIWIGSADFTENHRLIMNILFFPPGKDLYLDSRLVSQIILLLSIQRVSIPEFGPFLLTSVNQPQTAPLTVAKPTKFMFIVTLCICVGVSASIAGLVILLFVLRKRRRNASTHEYGFGGIGEIAPKFKGCRWFTLDELNKASNSFASSHLVGVGGYGKVYKGKLQTGEVVAIKRAEGESLQGLEEFRTEIELFSRLHHRNLVNLIGFCTDGGEQMLVYEFMPNRTLKEHLHEQSLNWKTRLSIALGSAKGLEYLHELADPPIIHRDIKSSNILLDENLVPKLADLGLSKLAPNCSEEKAYISIQVKGTLGYLDPEYYAYHQLSAKSDVFSFGVVLIEIITGKQPIDNGTFIVKEIKESVAAGGVASVLSFVDKKITDEVTVEQAKKYFRLALECVEDSGQDRPKMNEVVKKLEEIIKLRELHIRSQQLDQSVNKNSNSVEVELSNPDYYAWSSDADDPNLSFHALAFPAEEGKHNQCTGQV